MIQNGDIFVEVSQRVSAFMLYEVYCNLDLSDENCTREDQLDAIYRFLYSHACKNFIAYCAKHEGMTLDKYCKIMKIDQNQLL